VEERQAVVDLIVRVGMRVKKTSGYFGRNFFVRSSREVDSHR